MCTCSNRASTLHTTVGGWVVAHSTHHRTDLGAVGRAEDVVDEVHDPVAAADVLPEHADPAAVQHQPAALGAAHANQGALCAVVGQGGDLVRVGAVESRFCDKDVLATKKYRIFEICRENLIHTRVAKVFFARTY